MKKRISIVFAALLLTLSLVPLLGLLLFGSGAPAANEVLHAEPKLRGEDGVFNESVLNELSDWFGDHFALRREGVTAWAALKAALGSSANEKIVLGSEGWLFFEETLDDYRGLGLTDEALRETARNLRLMQDALAGQGTELLFVIAPNKNSLYPGHMPGRIENAHESSNAARLLPLLEEYGVKSADLFAAFCAQDETLYYRTDSHWTGRGAALAADTLLSALGREPGYFSQDFAVSGAHTGDLYEMLYPRGRATEPELQPAGGFAHRCLNEPRGGNAITIRTECGTGEGSLYCWRDSFGVSLYPYLADSFASAVFSRSETYDLTKAELSEADFAVLELVERNLANLWESPALYPAPQSEAPAAKTAEERFTVSVTPLSAQGLVRLSAEIPAALRDAGTSVGFTAGGVFCEAAVCAAENADCVLVTACVPESLRPGGLLLTQGGESVLYLCTSEVGEG